MDAPELIIPVRMDAAGATAGLQKASAAGRKAGDEVAAGANRAQKALQGMGGGAKDAATELLNLTKAHFGLGVLKGAAEKMMSVLTDAAEYTRKLAADFVQIQKTMQALAAISGKPNQNDFVREEIKKGEKANLTPAEWIDYRTAYMAKASMYVGDKEGSKLSEEDNEKLQAKTAEFSKGKGISTKTMADLIGGMLAQEKGKTTADEMLAKLGRAYAQLEASSTDPQQLMSGLTELMAAGFSIETAAPTIASMPEIAPAQEATYVQRTTMELGQQLREGKIGAKQGLREGMEPREQLKTVVKYLEEQMAKGRTPEEREKILRRAAGEITGESISFSTLTGLARKGTASMKQWEDLGAQTPADAVEKSIEVDHESDAGKVRAAEAKIAAGKAETGAKVAPENLMRLQAEGELEKEGRFDHPSMGALANDWIPKFLGADAKLREQQINARAIGNAKRQLGETDMEGVGMLSMNNAATDRVLKNLNARIELRNQSRREAAEGDSDGAQKADPAMMDVLKKIEGNTAKTAPEAKKDKAAEKPGGVPVALVPTRINGRT